jgi:hypothetical protein
MSSHVVVALHVAARPVTVALGVVPRRLGIDVPANSVAFGVVGLGGFGARSVLVTVAFAGSPRDFTSLIDDVEHKLFDRLPDDTWFYPGHGNDSTLGAERGSLPEWRARGW